MPYKLSDNGLCVMNAATGETVKCHPNHADATAHLKALMMNVPEAKTMHSILFDEFVNVKAGEPYRLFPFGKIIKNGKVREITPEYAATIKLPHFKPAIKLGSHEDATPAGGHILALEVRADGLYAVPEFNDKGAGALTDGAYRYHSPEIIWEGGLEDPQTGDVISAPLIVGDALLHTPHLGESAALYSVEEIETTKEQNHMDNMTIPTSFWDKFIAPLLEKKQEVKVETVEKIVEPEDYSAIKSELAQRKANEEKMVAEAARKSRVEKFDAELKDTKADPALSDILADLPEEKAALIMKTVKAMTEQIKESALTGEQGTPADGKPLEDPKLLFNSMVVAKAAEKSISYNAAFEIMKLEKADLFKTAFAK